MSGVISLVAFITVVFIVSFIVYCFIYNKRINEKLKNDESMTHNSMASIDTIGKFLTVFFVVAVIFIMFGELNGLKSDIEAQQASLSNQLSCVEAGISNLEDEMNRQKSLINSFQCIVGNMNVTDKTVEVQFVCTPKEYSKDTKLTLINGDKKIEFEYGENGNFTATKTFSIFENFEYESAIYMEENGVYKTSNETNIMPCELANDCLPELGRGDLLETNHKNGKVKFSGNILFENMDRFENVKLYALRNSEKIADLDDWNFENDNPSFNVEIDIKDEDSAMVVLSGTDEYGFVHKKVLIGQNFDDESMTGYDSIYDSEGNLLYGTPID